VSDTVDTLILDLLEWVGPDPRPYADVLEAWRTSCPRLPVWEDANDRGFITRRHEPGRGALVSVSAAGEEHLRKHRQPRPRRVTFADSATGEVGFEDRDTVSRSTAAARRSAE
jgi:hypothetical protein